MPDGSRGDSVKPGSLPFKSAVFRRGLLVVLIPGLLGSCLLLVLNFLWQSTAEISSEEQSHAEVVMNLGICFCALKNYGYDMMTSRNSNIPGYELRVNNDRKAFYQMLETLSATPVPADLRQSGGADIFADFRKSALQMVSDAEKLAPMPAVGLFNNNVGRLMRFRKLMMRGLLIADDIEKVIDKAETRLAENRARLSFLNGQLRGILAIGLPLGAAAALAVMFHFARGIVVRLKLLARNAGNLLALGARDTEKGISDEFEYLDSVFRQSAQSLRDAAEQRQAIAQMLAHDMRSPIMATQIYVDLLQEVNAGSMSETSLESCKKIKHNLGTVHDFVSDLLVAEKLEAERPMPELSHFFVKESLDEAIKELSGEIGNKKANVRVDCAEVSINADRERIVQCFKNYLLNALRFAPSESTITIVGSMSHGQARFAFRDEGRRASSVEVDYLFDPFRQTPPEGLGGISALGMNLRIARLLVEAHGGAFGGTANLESGREFWFSLPLDASTKAVLKTNRDSLAEGMESPSPSNSLVETSAKSRSVTLKELLSASSFQNCIMVFAATLLLQAGWLFWLDNRLNAAQVLANKAAVQSDTILEVNRLWLRIFRVSTNTSFFITSGNVENQAIAQRNIAEARALIGRLNTLLSQRDMPTTEWANIRSFLFYELSLLQKLSERSEGERAGFDLGLVGRLITRSGELNVYMRELMHKELIQLSTIRREQESLRDLFQGIIAFAIVGNLIMTVWLVWSFSKTITQRLALLVEVAKKIPKREPVTEMISGSDEIYQIYWLLCRAALNLNDAYEQRKSMMNMVAKDIGLPLAEVQKALAQLEGNMSSRIQETGVRSLKSARDNINRLLALDDDLLGLDQLEEGNLQLEKTPCSLLDIIDASVNSVGGLALKKQITIKKNCGNITLDADKKRMVQVLVNLLSNAIKFSPKASVIEVDGSMQDGRVRLSVKDEGPGISKQDAERIFARFYQTEEGKKQGFGLGLAICSLIVQCHDGQISVESHPGKGSTFIVTLPI